MSSDPEPEPETASKIKEEVKARPDVDLLASKERISGLFTILAAGFGLVSDGCRCMLLSSVSKKTYFGDF